MVGYQRILKLKNLTIYASGIGQNVTRITQFSISEGLVDSINILNLLSLVDIFKIIDTEKPSNVILCTLNMHGKEIVGLLEYFLSKRYKHRIFDITIRNSNSRTRTMIIKFQSV